MKRPNSGTWGRGPTAIEKAVEAAARRYAADPTPETWAVLYEAGCAALRLYRRFPAHEAAQRRAVFAELRWRGVVIRPEHSAGEGGVNATKSA